MAHIRPNIVLVLAGVILLGAGVGIGTLLASRSAGARSPAARPSTDMNRLNSMMRDMSTSMMGGGMASVAVDHISPANANTLGTAPPTGATVDRAHNHITLTGPAVSFTAVGSPDDGPDMTFRVAGLADPTITVPQGATVTVQFINADKDTAHGWLLSSAQPPFSTMAMMTAPPAFAGSFAMPVEVATATDMPSETISFTAGVAGQYSYLCPVMGHARQGMHGRLVVTR